MTQYATQSRSSLPGALDRNNPHDTPAPTAHPLLSAACPPPRVDASEPAELAVVVVRGYN